MHGDTLGSIVALSDNTGAVTDQFAYSSFGESDSMTGTTFGFTGQRFDDETGLYYFKNRYYSARLGRFLQPDPIGYDGEDLNLYTYVNNDPLNFTDPMGLQPGGGAGGGFSGQSGGGMGSGGPFSGGAGQGPGGMSGGPKPPMRPLGPVGVVLAIILVILVLIIVILILLWLIDQINKMNQPKTACAT